jgi:excinuclease UvrABC helicase subunit UvrB
MPAKGRQDYLKGSLRKMYADTITQSMQKAIEKTGRRQVQEAYNSE